MLKKNILPVLFFCALLLGFNQIAFANQNKSDRPNVLFITVDDMNWDSLGATGCSIVGITPHMDNLAESGFRFHHAHIMTSICGPSRSAMLTGRYPHCSGSMGHGDMPPKDWKTPKIKTPRLDTYLQQNGYYTAAILKSGRQINPTFNVVFQEAIWGLGFDDRNPDSFYKRTSFVIDEAKAGGKPFFIYANSIDPHDPWPRTKREAGFLKRWNPDSPYPQSISHYDPAEIDVPSFLPDTPAVRDFIAPYYDAVHRADDCVGSILKALKDSGCEDNTLIVFLSDHGMWPPGAKRSLHDNGTRTPLVFSWKGRITGGKVNRQHMVSSIDIMPTVIEAVGLDAVEGVEGRSLWPILNNQVPSQWREHVYAASNYFVQSTPEEYFPSRALIGKTNLYIFNVHAKDDPDRISEYDNYHDFMKVLKKEGLKDDRIAKRHDFFKWRPVEEFYDTQKDPGCWNNLIDDPEYKEEIAKYKKLLKQKMVSSNDPESDKL